MVPDCLPLVYLLVTITEAAHQEKQARHILFTWRSDNRMEGSQSDVWPFDFDHDLILGPISTLLLQEHILQHAGERWHSVLDREG